MDASRACLVTLGRGLEPLAAGGSAADACPLSVTRVMPPPEFDVRYTKLQWLGKGGFGVVYRAYDARLDRDVAIKLLNPEFAADPLWRQRFRQEATAASRLNHPNITIVYDRSEEGNQLYIVMEFVEGKPLSSFIRDRIPLTDPERLLLLEQLCDGLQFAHQRQIIHRDIKPENLIIRDEPDGSRTLKILDFGIAKMVNANQTKSDGQLLCTPSYVSPELIRNDPVDHRSDIFAVGAVAYELLVLEKTFVFSATSVYGLLDEMRHKIVEQPHRPMQAVRPGIDPELGAIVDRALAKDVAQRYRDLSEMRRGLRRVRERLEAAVSGDTVLLKAPEQHLLKQANQFIREGNLTAAINLLEADLPFAPNRACGNCSRSGSRTHGGFERSRLSPPPKRSPPPRQPFRRVTRRSPCACSNDFSRVYPWRRSLPS